MDETVNLLDKYKELSTFDDVIEALDFVSASDSVRPLIFTNGTEDMVQKALSSPSLSAHAKLFRSIVSVEQLNPKVYKPHPAVYQHLAKSTGKEDRLDEVWVVTANPFDVVGARAVGLQAAWVDRERRGWQDKCLGDDFRPSITGANLKELVEVIATI